MTASSHPRVGPALKRLRDEACGEGRRSRRALVHTLATASGADIAIFARVAVLDDEPRFAELIVIGDDDVVATVAPLVGEPMPEGAFASTEPALVAMRRGQWTVTRPADAHHNAFACLADEFEDMASLRRTALWRRLYGPFGVQEQLRALMYDRGAMLGAIALIWCGARAPAAGIRADLADSAEMIREALIEAAAVDRARFPTDGPIRGLYGADGALEEEAGSLHRWLDEARAAQVSARIRRFADSGAAEGVALVDDGELRLSRLTTPRGPRVQVSLTRARPPRLISSAAPRP